MITNQPLKLDVSPHGVSSFEKAVWLFGHYDLRIYVTDTAYIDVGRGSMAAASRLKYLIPGYVGCIGTVGQFCDFAQCQIFGGGEHHNDLPVNVTFTGSPVLQAAIRQNRIESLQARGHAPFSIGNAVLISSDAKVLSGAVIGDGAFIAANALVRGNMEPFSVYGGLPAEKLKDRVDDATKAALAAVRWWDFDLVYLTQNLERLQELAVNTTARHVYRKESPRFVLEITGTPGADNCQVHVLGFADSQREYTLSDAPTRVREYIQQMSTDGPYYWVADAWL